MTASEQTVVIWAFQAVAMIMLGLIAWFLKRAARDLDHCEASIRELERNELPKVKERTALLEHRMGSVERDVEQLQLRDVVRSGQTTETK